MPLSVERIYTEWFSEARDNLHNLMLYKHSVNAANIAKCCKKKY